LRGRHCLEPNVRFDARGGRALGGGIDAGRLDQFVEHRFRFGCHAGKTPRVDVMDNRPISVQRALRRNA